MKTKFLSACLGIAAVLFASGFLIRSVNPANAAPAPESFANETYYTGSPGKYQFITLNTGSSEESILVWNTESAASAIYEKKSYGYTKATWQLPKEP